MASYIRRLIRLHKPKARTLLELACGTGAILKVLAKSYDVAGLDLSPQRSQSPAGNCLTCSSTVGTW
jgi:cyclopropane fatty-acyl-phospholipid synthase-like methyltransferase